MGTFVERIRQQLIPGRTVVIYDKLKSEKSSRCLVLGPVAGDQMEPDHDYVDLAIENMDHKGRFTQYSDVVPLRLSDIHSVQLVSNHDEEAHLHEVQYINCEEIPHLSEWSAAGYLVTTMGDSMRPTMRFFPVDMRFQGLKCGWDVDLTLESNPIEFFLKPAMEFQS